MIDPLLRRFPVWPYLLLITALPSLAQKTDFANEIHPAAPDYSDPANWAALPFRYDMADVLPKNGKQVQDSLKRVDVFYVHPTVYLKGPLWNADLNMTGINKRADRFPVKLQASVFNETCRVFAPRYRQAIVDVFHQPSEDGDRALDLAYEDVKRAFRHYLETQNNGRPFIIAGHSQGTYHTRRLLIEMIDTTVLRAQLVAAYIIGFTVNESMFTHLRMCRNATETGCLISWQSYRDGYRPDGVFFRDTESVNPLSWSTDTALIVRERYEGTVVLNPNKRRSRRLTARITDIGGRVLWVRTRAPLFRLLKDLHVADYGLFYMDIRENVKQRVDAYPGR